MAGLVQSFSDWLAPIADPLAYISPHLQKAAPVAPHAEALLKRLELQLRHKLRHVRLGEQKSLIRGQGLDFAELREYAPGDDFRKIDWNVFARTLTPHIKEFHEEKQLTAWLYIDLTPSMFFGQSQTKAQQAVDLAGLLGLLLGSHRLGAMIVMGHQAEIIEPRLGRAHLQRILQRVLALQAVAHEQIGPVAGNLLQAQFKRLEHLVEKGASVFFISDYVSPPPPRRVRQDRKPGKSADASESGESLETNKKADNESDPPDWLRSLGELSRRATLFHLLVQDVSETALPPDGWAVFDPESRALLPGGTAVAPEAFAHAMAEQTDRLMRTLAQTGQTTRAQTGEDAVDILLRLLRRTA